MAQGLVGLHLWQPARWGWTHGHFWAETHAGPSQEPALLSVNLSLRPEGGSENALRTVRCRFGELLLEYLGKQQNIYIYFMSFLAWNALKALTFENTSSVGDAHGSLHSSKLILLLGDFTH